VDFCFMSDTIKSLPQLTWLRKGTPIPKGTATAQLNADAGRVAAGDRVEAEIDIMDWLGDHPVGHGDGAVSWARQLWEDVDRAQLPVGGEDETYEEDDGDDDHGMAERWTPRFGR
jgi:hypothetical protein